MKVFYVKFMDGKHVVLKELDVFDIGDHKIDQFLASHGVNAYWYSTRRVQPSSWSDTEGQIMKEWFQWHSVKCQWVLIRDSLVPDILRMRQLVGAL